jgi:hypothetical protein
MHFWVPSGPAEIDTGARGQLKAALARNGSKGDPKIWDPGPAKIDAPVAEIRDRCLTLARSEEDPQNHLRHTARTQEHLVPLALASLGLGSRRPLGPCLKPIPEIFACGLSSMRLI